MAITLVQQQNLLALTVGLFSAAPGARNLTDFAASFEANGFSYVALANDLIATATYQSQYAGIVTLEGRIDKALANLGITEGSDAYTIAREHFEARAAQGASEAEILVEAVEYLLSDRADEAFAAPQAQLANRVEIATFFSVERQRSADSLEELKSVVASVTADPASVEAAMQAIESGSMSPTQPGQTFTLTANADNLSGTNGNDIFRALDKGSLSDADVINGGDGRDTLNIADGAIAVRQSGPSIMAPVGGTAAPVITSVETINNADIDSTLDLADVSGVELINSQASTKGGLGDFTYENASTSTVFMATNLFSHVNIGYRDNGDTARLALANEQDAATRVTFDLSGNDDIKFVTLEAMTGSSNVSFTHIESVETLTVTGAGDLSAVLNSSTFARLETFDASAATGDMTVTLSAGTRELTLLGGAGDDALTSRVDDATLNGGAGNDTLGGTGNSLTLTGGEGRDEFRFTTQNRESNITDFTVGEDVISLLQGGKQGLTFAASTNSGIDGASDLASADFSKLASFANLTASQDQRVVVFNQSFDDRQAIDDASASAPNASGAEIFFVAFNEDAGHAQLFYRGAGQDEEVSSSVYLVANIEGLDLVGVQGLTTSSFDIYTDALSDFR